MSRFWKSYYDQHVEQVSGEQPFHRVGRTLHQEAMPEEMFMGMVERVISTLNVGPEDDVLDLCCGNGLMTVELAKTCKSLLAVDFSLVLIDDLRKTAPDNVETLVSDALALQLEPGQYDRLLFAAAIQHFDQPEIIKLFSAFSEWLKPSGVLMVTDILDSSRLWNFYAEDHQVDLYFQKNMDQEPILGTWLDPVWMQKLAKHVGFSSSKVIIQPPEYWYSHYRFDLVCYKDALLDQQNG